MPTLIVNEQEADELERDLRKQREHPLSRELFPNDNPYATTPSAIPRKFEYIVSDEFLILYPHWKEKIKPTP